MKIVHDDVPPDKMCPDCRVVLKQTFSDYWYGITPGESGEVWVYHCKMCGRSFLRLLIN